jgi:glyoxylase-like metal-dependent hydrolase (beta-lactamase superfamily II)
MPAHSAVKYSIQTIDLNFQGIPGTIAAYMVPHRQGVALVECGPGSTLAALQAGLKSYGYQVSDVTDVLLTHIHLDHAGAAGWLARQGACVHVHPAGTSHLINPEKLLSSAARIYGDMMETLWGEFLPVPEERLFVVQDNDEIDIDGQLRFRALETPGHAYHHHAYITGDTCFTGDIGGVRVGGQCHVRLPMPPPDLNLELWRSSLERLENEYKKGSFSRLAPTHFGIYDDPVWYLDAIRKALDETEAWITQVMPASPSLEELQDLITQWMNERFQRDGVEPSQVVPLEMSNPSWMSAQGIYRYWRKVRNPQAGT